MENANKVSIHLRNRRDLREKILGFLDLQRVCKSFTAEVTKEYAKLYSEALCFFEVAEYSNPAFVPFLQSFKIWLHRSHREE